MSGTWLTNQQVERYMKARQSGCTQVVSAAKAGISERSGRAIDHGQRIDPRSKERDWRTRQDPLVGVWENELCPMLKTAPGLQPMTLLEHLQDKYPEQYPDKILRTLQRRVREWLSLNGPEKEVMFSQVHEPGKQGLSDFTHLKGVVVTIQGEVFKHILYHFRLAFSHWSSMKVILGGESYTALAEGLQEALLRLGGSPFEHRTDSLSAAYKNLTRDEQEDITARYVEFCAHFNMNATRNNLGVKHENGSVEAAHGHLKNRVRQALLKRGSTDFNSITEYQAFIDTVVQQHNRRNAKTIAVERPLLQTLPARPAADYTQIHAHVTSGSTMTVKRMLYTVPTTLVGQTLNIRLYDDRLLCYVGSNLAVTLERIYSHKRNGRARSVDYRHVIGSLRKKPGAFRGSILRNDLLPNDHYREIWRYIDRHFEGRQACKTMVGLLYLAAEHDCEKALAEAVLEKIAAQADFTLLDFERRFGREMIRLDQCPDTDVQQHALTSYDQLINASIGDGIGGVNDNDVSDDTLSKSEPEDHHVN